jgi:hypothetical protein
MNNPIRPAIWYKFSLVVLLAVGMLGSVTLVNARSGLPSGIVGPTGTVTHLCPDSHETDDFYTDAKPLTTTPQLRNFDGDLNVGIDDKDWARFFVTRGSIYTITTSGLSPSVDTLVTLFGDPNSNPIIQSGGLSPDFHAQIVWTAPFTAGGWYYLKIENEARTPLAYANCAGQVASYTLSLQSKQLQIMSLPIIMKNY